MSAAYGAGGVAVPSLDVIVRQLQQLQSAHDEEVRRLRDEIAVLSKARSSPPPLLPPEDDAGKAVAAEASTPSTQEEAGAAEKPADEMQALATVEPQSSLTKPNDSARSSSSRPAPRKSKTSLRSYVAQADDAPLTWSLRDWRACGRQIVLAQWFEMAVGVAILLNIVLIFLSLELRGRTGGVALGLAARSDMSTALDVVDGLGSVMTGFFLVEVVAKVVFLRTELIVDEGKIQWFNMFDIVVVVLTCLDTWVLSAMQSDEAGTNNLSLMRAFRIVRVLRILRVARTFNIFASLRVLCSAVFASFFALFWAMVLLSVVMLMAGLFLCESLVDTIQDPEFDVEFREWAYMHWGTASRSCWSVFQLTFSGGWPNYAKKLVEQVSTAYAFFFVVYVTSVTFAMFRIITAMFLKDTLRVAALDIDNTINEKLAEKEHYKEKLAAFFEAADESGDGDITLEEFDKVMEDDRVRAYFASLDLDPSKTRSLFMLADEDGSGTVSVSEFVATAMSMKGVARAQDIALMEKDLHAVSAQLGELQLLVRRIHDETLEPSPVGI